MWNNNHGGDFIDSQMAVDGQENNWQLILI